MSTVVEGDITLNSPTLRIAGHCRTPWHCETAADLL